MPEKVKLQILKKAGISKVLDTQELGTIEIKIHRRKLSIAPLREAKGF
jgi:beta-lactamase superfamily II metal-dependent hydrolase